MVVSKNGGIFAPMEASGKRRSGTRVQVVLPLGLRGNK